MFAPSFIAVYREVLETVLFFSAWAADGNSGVFLAGLLGGVAWLFLRTNSRVPISKFFSISLVLVAVLAVVLAGKRVAGLPEARWADSTPILMPRTEVWGMYLMAPNRARPTRRVTDCVAGVDFNLFKACQPWLVRAIFV